MSGDLHPLTALGLPGIGFVEQLDVVPDGLVVIALDASELVGNVHPVMLGDLHVSTIHDNVHQGDLLGLSSRDSETSAALEVCPRTAAAMSRPRRSHDHRRQNHGCFASSPNVQWPGRSQDRSPLRVWFLEGVHPHPRSATRKVVSAAGNYDGA
jgi:hypothetical protein